ncbi:hypothetical protein AB4138_10770 [Vibrio sp. 10N.286.52.C3]|uniref:Uncharacterized protein n=1 Tax=Vibrio splendidus TaxID=29497 RepID=A0A7Y4D2F1_VIBSP|nr:MULTISPECIES: hypothetical protein [Vibrio]NOJ11280.1 hypothetical protein [Vibrio splendidus]TKF72303.1 hypothetical protein FCV59_15080 [Vibrio sp. F13]
MFTFFKGRSVGKQIAASLDIKANLFLTSLEQVMPAHLQLLANLHKTGSSIEELRDYTAPLALQGLEVLEERFGQQSQIDDARNKLNRHLTSSQH